MFDFNGRCRPALSHRSTRNTGRPGLTEEFPPIVERSEPGPQSIVPQNSQRMQEMILVDVNEFCDILNMQPNEVKDMMISGESGPSGR
jgi:hypothetical protein